MGRCWQYGKAQTTQCGSIEQLPLRPPKRRDNRAMRSRYLCPLLTSQHTHARAAWVCADNADHHRLRAWVPATQHTVAFWEHRFLDAARYAEDGLRYATTGSAEAFLASAQALDLAKAGQADDARTALARARGATEVVEQACDELAGPFTCSVDRAGGFWSDVYLASPSTR